MNVLVIGGTGRTGKKLIVHSLRKGYNVTALVLKSAKFDLWDDNLKVIRGDALNIHDVNDALVDQDAVFCDLGNKTSFKLSKKNVIISKILRNLIIGMKNRRVKRLIFLSSYGCNKNFPPFEEFLLKTFHKKMFMENVKQEELINASGLDFTIVHPARLTNMPKTGAYKSGDNLAISLSSTISRADVADFFVNNVENEALSGKTVTIRY